MVNRVKINGQFETVAQFSSCYQEPWQACLEGLAALSVEHFTYGPGLFSGVDGVYPRDSDVHSRFIHYRTSLEELSHSEIMIVGYDALKKAGNTVLHLVTSDTNQPPEHLPEKHRAVRQTYCRLPITDTPKTKVEVA